MKLGYKLLGFQVLVAIYVLLFVHELALAPLIYGRLLTFFLMGAAFAFFVQGPKYGTLHPISTRPVMVGLGVLMTGASRVWGFAIKNHL